MTSELFLRLLSQTETSEVLPLQLKYLELEKPAACSPLHVLFCKALGLWTTLRLLLRAWNFVYGPLYNLLLDGTRFVTYCTPFFLRNAWFMVQCTPSSSAALGLIAHCTPSACVALCLWSTARFILARHLVLLSTARLLLAWRFVCGPLYNLLLDGTRFVIYCTPFFLCNAWFMVHCTLSSSAALGFIVHCTSSACVALRLWSTLQFIVGRHLNLVDTYILWHFFRHHLRRVKKAWAHLLRLIFRHFPQHARDCSKLTFRHPLRRSRRSSGRLLPHFLQHGAYTVSPLCK